jgi:hypothetical protein
VKKKVHTWVWIRSSIPNERVWKKCIEYTVTDKNGKNETYSLDENTGTRIKVYTHVCVIRYTTVMEEFLMCLMSMFAYKRLFTKLMANILN